MFSVLVPTTSSSIQDGYVQVTASNVQAPGYDFTETKILNPYGYYSVPVDYAQGFMLNSMGSVYQRFVGGYFNVLSSTAPQLVAGESMHFTMGWYIVYHNSSVQYQTNPDTNVVANNVTATAANGEGFQQMMLNRIAELQANVTYLTGLVNQLQSHTHTSGESGSPTSTPIQTFTNPSTPSTFAKDNTYLGKGGNAQCLINQYAKVYS